MSNAAVGHVWKSSRAKGSELLVLLKIADWADEDGRNAYGSVVKIAALCRMTDRAVRDILKRLVAAGELEVERNVQRRRVRNGYCPRAFMHVLGVEPEESSASAEASNRKNLPVQPEHSSGSTSGRDFRLNRKMMRTEPEAGRTPIRKIRQGSVSTHERRARDGRRPHPLDEPIVASPKSLELLDELSLVYPRKDGSPQELARVWRELNLGEEQARFVIAHVRMRVADGWVGQAGGLKYIPMLWRFLEGRRWEERAAPAIGAPLVSAAWGPDGTLTMASCPECGELLEGRVKNGKPVYPACPRCTTNTSAEAQQQMERVV